MEEQFHSELIKAGCKEVNAHSISKYQKLIEEYPYSLESYYSSIQQHTFLTKFVELDIETLLAIKQYYQHHVLAKAAPSEHQLQLLSKLEDSIDKEIKSFGGNVGAFVRLSRRSPKDALLDCKMCYARVIDMMCEKLRGVPENDIEQELRVTLDCIVRGMRVSSGKEAMELILNSERVYHDMLLATDFPKAQLAGDGRFFVSAIIRKWQDILVEAEFRAFVFHRKITAISQYCDIFYFGQQYVDRKPAYKNAIVQKFDEIKSKLPVDSCILDLAVLEDGRVFVIELNPFKTTTGAGLFDWGHDKAILENSNIQSEDEIEFRVIDEPIDYTQDGLVSEEWKKLIKTAREKKSVSKSQNCIIA